MNPRLCVTLTEHGEIATICADAPVDVFIVDPKAPADRVYQYEPEIGPEYVRMEIGGYAIGHAADGTLGEGDGSGRRPPIKPRLGAVPEKNEATGDVAVDRSCHISEVWARAGDQTLGFTSLGDAVAHYAENGLTPDRAMMWIEDRGRIRPMLVDCTADLEWRAKRDL